MEEGGNVEVDVHGQRPLTIFMLIIGVRDTYTKQFLDTLTMLGIRTLKQIRLLR